MPFDPFSDRMARDIRNSLSSALVRELSKSEGATVADVAGQWRARRLDEAHRTYIEDRQREYRQILAQVRTLRIECPQYQAIVLWNAGFFFELHELLETIWHGAKEPEHTGLKGLIQAAGAYLHSRRGKTAAAQKLALRARFNLKEGAAALSFVANLEMLIEALSHTPPTPLHLVCPSFPEPQG